MPSVVALCGLLLVVAAATADGAKIRYRCAAMCQAKSYLNSAEIEDSDDPTLAVDMIEVPKVAFTTPDWVTGKRDFKAFAPHLSADQMEAHYDGHLRSYAARLNEYAGDVHMHQDRKNPVKLRLHKQDSVTVAIIRDGGKTFPKEWMNPAGQLFAHALYFAGLKYEQKYSATHKATDPAEVLAKIDKQYGSMENFHLQVEILSQKHFASGWMWLVHNMTNDVDTMELLLTPNAQVPLSPEPYNSDVLPLLALDLWEHAYYVDYRADRRRYVMEWLKLIDWSYAQDRLDQGSVEWPVPQGYCMCEGYPRVYIPDHLTP